MRIPSGTYRLQFNSSFGFDAARRVIPYLAELGIDTVYASPIFKARRGSTHGYDVTDPTRLNPEAGSPQSFDALIETVHQHGFAWIQDFVPNHMAYASDNAMLMDVFEKGQSSRFFAFFDILWDHLRENLRGKVIAPFLGKPYGETLESGELNLVYEEGRFAVKYYDLVYPLRIESYASIIDHNLDELRRRLGDEHPGYVRTLAVTSLLKRLPVGIEEMDAEARNSLLILAQETLRDLHKGDAAIRDYIDRAVATFNADADLLHSVLSEQWFQLTYWRVATKEINYQRFFNINDLISFRMEDEHVFNHVHRFALGLLGEGKINGLRIDHVDGLYDPTEYLARLRRSAGQSYITVEKILELHEEIPRAWPVEGTTGYEFMNYVNSLFVDTENAERFRQIYSDFAGEAMDYADLLYEKRMLIIERHLTGDLDNLTHILKNISTETRDAIDLEWGALRTAIAETSAVFPVYRTYITSERIEDRDRAYIEDAIKKARLRKVALDRALDFLERVLLLDFPDHLEQEQRPEWLAFVMRFQQFTSPLMAKGLEDTAFYVYNRLISLNEVGGDPGTFGISGSDFHAFNERRAKTHPHTMNATATHDTKRGEDTRARINVLSEIPNEWERQVEIWHEQNRPHKKKVGGEEVPDKNREYFIYQTLVGAFPFDEREVSALVDRMKEYVIKAAREAKTHTFWLDHNSEYEEALLKFTESILTPSESNQFLKSLASFQERVAHYGVFNSLSQLLLKITSPGLPDFYQGSELWDLSLVDPDNRRAVDYEKRERIIRELSEKEEAKVAGLLEELLSSKGDGRIKMFATRRALKARSEMREVFEAGDYLPLKVTGKRSRNAIAFARRRAGKWAVTVAPRFFASLIKPTDLPIGKEVWSETAIELPADAPARWRNAFSDETIDAANKILIGDALKRFPIALVVGE